MSGTHVERISDVPRLEPRKPDSHKGTYGRVLLVAGSRGMAGAAVLAGCAALRGGAGLVRMAVPMSIQATVAAGNPCYTTTDLPEDSAGRISRSAEERVLALVQENNVVAVGPGLGRSGDLDHLVGAILQQSSIPLVLDADGFNALDHCKENLLNRPGPTVVTPHPGELAKFLGTDIGSVQKDREGVAVKFAVEHGVVLVLKGRRTLVTDGRGLYVNTTGNPGMATGGTGDVLTGLIAALLGQGLEMFAAARLGVYLHGLAGDLASEARGEVSLIASDLIEYLAQAFRSSK